MAAKDPVRIAIVGAGTIGLSFAALHLTGHAHVTIYDPRPDLRAHIEAKLPEYIQETPASLLASGALRLTDALATAVADADIVQEQGPEKVAFKQQVWADIEAAAPPTALFWSSTSGIPVSVQATRLSDPTRLLVVHPFNPPHIMPLLEVTPGPATAQDVVNRTLAYWKTLGRDPVVLKQEATGFVANRLAFALFREAAYLVDRGVASAEDIDRAVEQSLGPRWAVRGPFWSYQAGGGAEGGLTTFLDKIGDTIQACWDDGGRLDLADKGWQDKVCAQTEAAYGQLGPDELRDRDERLRAVLAATKRE